MNALAAIAAMLATAFHLRRRNQGSRLQRRERSAEIRTAPGMVPVGEVAAQHRRAKARADREEPAVPGAARGAEVKGDLVTRSEEHTSELQSHSDLVCRLLLEKKKENT